MEELSQEEKTAALCDAVMLENSPEKVAEKLRSLGEVENTAYPLGLAVRFRGLEYVKALVGEGATFFYNHKLSAYYIFSYRYWLALIDYNSALKGMWGRLNDKSLAFNPRGEYVSADGRKVTVKSLSIESRIEIMKFLYENREEVWFNPDELLFYSIMNGADKMTDALKKLGVKLSEKSVKALTESGNSFIWLDFTYIEASLSYDEYFPVMTRLIEELDGKLLHYTNKIFDNNYAPRRKQYRLYDPKFFTFFLEHYNQKKMNKTAVMKGAINMDSVVCLAKCVEYGWLALPRKRDEMIQFALDNGKTECSAWLLDYKNRTADLAAERLKAEKKLERELNADPNSVTELKKIWSYEKLEGGGVSITRYKGGSTEIKVPEKIGKETVVAVGSYAFSPDAARVTSERTKFLRTIKKITLPNTIKTIGEGAFQYLIALETVNIPDGVEVIGGKVFCLCRALESMKFPESVRELGEMVFSGCENLKTVKLPSGITEIGTDMFNWCRNLREVNIPNSVKRIGASSFHGCMELSEIVLPDGVEEIGNIAFQNCDNLKTIVLPASIKSIKNYKINKDKPPVSPFADAKELKAFVVPKSYAEKYCKRNEIPYEYMEEHKV